MSKTAGKEHQEITAMNTEAHSKFLTEGWQEPTGLKTIKRGKTEVYQTTTDPDGARFVNTNKICRPCPLKDKCYRGRHAMIAACDEGSRDH